MKVLLVNKFFYRRGGAEVVFFNTARLLREAGHQVVEFSMHHPQNERSPYSEFFVRHVDFPSLKAPLSLLREAARAVYSREARRKIARLVERERPDVAHLHNYYFHLTPSILYALRAADVPVVHTVHDYHLVCPNHALYDYRRQTVCEDCPRRGPHRVLLRGCMQVGRARSIVAFLEALVYRLLGTYDRLVERYIAPSQFMRSKITPRPVSPEKVVVLPNTVDDFGPPSPPPDNGPIFYAGRLSREKGLDLILDVARRLPSTRWHIAGEGPIGSDLRCAVKTDRLANVEFLGRLDPATLREQYRRSAAVVLPSRCYENCPLALLEAMSAGRPAIGARTGGIAELIRHGQTGWLFEPGSADDLERIARFATSERGELTRVGRKARSLFIERYSPATHLERLIAVYEEAIEAKRKGSNGTNRPIG